jgi:nicotinate-nucleotide adenylyltransferase
MSGAAEARVAPSGRPGPAAGLTGVFGGTFNPVHLGHLRAAEEVCEQLGLVRMLFVPSADPPLKRESAQCIAPAHERLDWVRRATDGNPRFDVDALELERSGPSYSVDTFAILARRLAPERPVFVIGCDAFAELGSWREPERLLTLCHFAVITRPASGGARDGAPAGTHPAATPGGLAGAAAAGGRDPEAAGDVDPEADLAAWVPDGLSRELELSPDGQSGRHRRADTWIRRLEIRALDISATDIRRRLRERRSVRYLLPEGVRRAVIESGIYAEPRTCP